MLNNKLILFILPALLFCTGLRAQDPEFSQFFAVPIYTNPAYTGSEYGRLAAVYRMQYYGIPGGFNTFNLSYDQHASKLHGGYGVMITHDVAGEGVLTANHINLDYAFEYETKKKINFRLGIQAGLVQKILQWDRLRWGDQITPGGGFITNETYIDKAVSFWNFATGLLVYSKNWYAGFACHNITEPNQSFFGNTGPGTELPRRYTLHGGYIFDLRNEIKLSPNVLMMTQGKYSQLVIGANAAKGHVIGGFWFRQTNPNSDAVIGFIGANIKAFKVGYSMDITISKLRSAGKTAHELTLIYSFNKKQHPRELICPGY
jgi:type IX secretion system PorP/SprF family membrane protein